VTDTAEELEKLASFYTGERILAAQEIIHQAMNELRFTARGRITAEMCLYDLCREDNRTLKALAARINRLEQEMAALKAGGLTVAVSQEPAAVAASVEAAKPKPDEPVARDIPQKQEPAAGVKEETQQQSAATADREKKEDTAVQRKPVAAVPPVQSNPLETPAVSLQNAATSGNSSESSDGSYTAYGSDWATGDEYWTRAMEILKAERKNSIASCASHGSVLAYENQTLIVGFKMKFLCERLQKPDYREVVEEILLRVARVPVRLQCVTDTGGKTGGYTPAGKTPGPASKAKTLPAADSVKPVPKQQEPATADPEQNVSASTKKAMEMFKATLHKV
jgi:DNA polymerase-3 subunit gamma/tau